MTLHPKKEKNAQGTVDNPVSFLAEACGESSRASESSLKRDSTLDFFRLSSTRTLA